MHDHDRTVRRTAPAHRRGRRWPLGRVGVATVALGLALATASSAAASVAGQRVAPRTAWGLQIVHNPSSGTAYELVGVTCVTSSLCEAGGYTRRGADYSPLAARWSGAGAWIPQTTATPAGSAIAGLLGVACASSTQCEGVGFSEGAHTDASPLAEAFNGHRWTIQTVPRPAGASYVYLQSVACQGSSCQAVGYYGTPKGVNFALAEGFNGHRWSLETVQQPSSTAGSFAGVACPAVAECVAVGHYSTGSITHALAEHWSGARWTSIAAANVAPTVDTLLRAVSCPAINVCVAVGNFAASTASSHAFAERWNGASWSSVPTATHGSAPVTFLDGVSCPTPASCGAVGKYATTPTNGYTLAEVFTGSAFHLQATPTPPGSINATINGVACETVTTCEAVGIYDRTGDVGTPLAMRN